MIDLKLNKRRLKNHWQYSRISYIMAVIIALMSANIIFSATEPPIPANEQVNIQVYVGALDYQTSDLWAQDILAQLDENQKEVVFVSGSLGEAMQSMELLYARFAAQEGTMLIVPDDLFRLLAQQGALLPLGDLADRFALPPDTDSILGYANVDATDDTPAQNLLLGIPLDRCMGLYEAGIAPEGAFICLPFYCENVDNAIIAANYLLGKTEISQEWLERQYQ